MSDVNNNDQGAIWPAGNSNVQQTGFSGNAENEELSDVVYDASREVKRESLYDMNALAGLSQVKNKKMGFQSNQPLFDKNTGIEISPDRLSKVSSDLQPFLKQRPSVAMRASALGDFAFGSAVKENLTDPYAKAALIEYAAAQEFAEETV